MSITIQFLGAAGCVTGSQFLVSTDRARVVVDCGLFQGSPEEIERNHLPFAYEPDSIDALILTHAHLDHCGRTPALVKRGFRGPIHATGATVDLAEIVLRDSAKLQVEFAERWNRRHASEAESEAVAEETDDESLPERLRSAPPEGRTETRRPLYDERDVDQAMTQMRGSDYGDEIDVADGVTAVLHDAGHILGSAIVELRIADGDERRTIVFSGDLGRDGSPIIRDPAPIAHADAVVVESTYGNREHADHEAAIDELVAAIGEVSADEGVLLVPAFAIGRTQEVIWVLDELVRQGRIPRVPLYLDSPMASRATDVYHDHPEIYDAETKDLIASGESPLEYPGQQFTDTVEQSKAIRHAKRPIMVVASSGMLTGGRIMHHLKDFLPDPTCTLLFIGYQGEGTLGRHIQNGGQSARIDGQEIPVRCRVRSISGFSAHADQHELEAWLRHFGDRGTDDAGGSGRPKRVFIVHGDPDAAEAFAGRIRDGLGMEAHVPRHRERVAIP
ncbi:MAG TPA: MBL fold metallo-hydrolase RNA specificity domain-containing protein [Candidatus Limnocylindrales bacterium]|nr:MBL fold metallo-hydrolase RNA specificity domain-containing protein [Candidatus Limnocylindrales bacterium]